MEREQDASITLGGLTDFHGTLPEQHSSWSCSIPEDAVLDASEPMPGNADEVDIDEMAGMEDPYGFDPDETLMKTLGIASVDGMDRETRALHLVSRFLTQQMRARDPDAFLRGILKLVNIANPKSRYGFNVLFAIEDEILKHGALGAFARDREKMRRNGF